MDDVYRAVIYIGFAQNDIFFARLIIFNDIFDALEEDQIDGARTIGEFGNQSFPGFGSFPVEADDFPPDLYVALRRIDFADAVKSGAINVFV
jgi:hypothetical protein